MQAKRTFLPILLVMVFVVFVIAACNAGAAGQEKTWFNLPSVPVDIDASGAASVYGIGVAQLPPEQVKLIQSLGQKVELRAGANGIHFYIDGQDQPYIAWNEESAANLEKLLASVPTTASAAPVIPWLRRIGLGAAISVPPASGSAKDIPAWRGETAVSPQAPANQMPPVALGVSFDESGAGSIGGISGDLLAPLTGGANPLQLDPALVAQLKSFGIENLGIQTTPGGLAINVNGAPLPGLAYDGSYLERLAGLLPSLPGVDAATAGLVSSIAGQLPAMNLGLNVDLSGQPVDLKLSDLPVKLGDDGSLQVLGLAIPGVTLPMEALQPLRDLGVAQLAINASTEAINIAVDGNALPRIRFAPDGLATIAGIAGAQSGLPPALLDAGLNTLLKDGITTRIALSGEVDQSAAPAEATFAPADLGDMAAPVIRAKVGVKGGQIVSVGDLSADQLAQLGVTLPALPPNVMQILSDLDAKTVDIVNTPNNLSIQVNGAELMSIDYDAASLATALNLAKPYLAGTPLEDPAVMQLIVEQILPIAPAADVNVQITVE
ncbi:MAG TPA: hypothetical protein DCL15_09630 [Chloroflexi bacterium]|nr:hypothetical protein [Chloroflexota bacterium]HHW86214.1 hypothetical protein [Chloroflexota bacterium]